MTQKLTDNLTFAAGILIFILFLNAVAHAETCEASYYSGGRTASGGRVGPMTAAHKTLPFGTRVRVTTRDGRSVVLTITDRGPWVRGRCLDVSADVAPMLGLVGLGHRPVTVTVL